MHAGCKLTPDHFKFAASAERTPVSRGDDFEGPGGSTCLWVSLSYIWAALFAATASTMAWVVVPVRSTMATWRGAIAGPVARPARSTAPRGSATVLRGEEVGSLVGFVPMDAQHEVPVWRTRAIDGGGHVRDHRWCTSRGTGTRATTRSVRRRRAADSAQSTWLCSTR